MTRSEVLAILTEVLASAEVARRKMGPGVHSVGDVLRAGIQACASEGEEPSEPPPRRCATCRHVMRGLAQYPCVQCASEPGNKPWEAQHSQSVRTIGGGAGTASDLTAGNTIHALAAKLDAARLAVVLHEQMEAELVSKLDAALSERDQAEAIIHALVDERVQARWDFEALGRVFIRQSVRQDEQDDPKGALDEDELLPLERRILASLGSEGKSASRLWMELEGKVRGAELDACLACLEAADYVVFLRGAWRRTAKPVDGEVAGPPKPALLLRSAGWRVEGPK